MRTFTVYGAPVGKERARVISGRAYTPSRTKAYEQWVQLAAREANIPLLQGPVQMTLVWAKQVPASWSKKHKTESLDKVYATGTPDLDNVIKAVSDALNGIAYIDDSQVAVISASRIFVEQPSHVVIDISPLSNWGNPVATNVVPWRANV